MAIHNDIGVKGEQLAKEFLLKKGYEILEENWTYNRAEVDLIACIGGTVVFVEVKTRTGTGFGMPEDFVDQAKQKRLAEAAEAWLELMDYNTEIRFDIIAVLIKELSPSIKHIEDAFWPNEI